MARKKLLGRLLNMFPYFFTKSPDSNFYKSQSVTSERFKDLYISLRDTYDSFDLDKKCIIFKEQVEDYEYVMHFLCSIPLLESVQIFMESHLIYEANFELSSDESYSFMVEEIFHNWEEMFDEDEQSYFVDDMYTETHTIHENITTIDYSYNQTSGDIIPDTQYHITVTTFDEYVTSKGFPENDTIQGDIYDHDISLDEIGALTNIPRKKYIPSYDYANTEPAYNNRLTEDDYHYMQRMLEYLLLIQETSLPVAEIFKIYGLKADLLNRDRFLIRMFDIFNYDHYYDKTTDGDQLFVGDWTPNPWEHKDRLCDGSSDLGEFFFVDINTTQPVRKQPVYFYFDFINSLAETLTGDYTVDIYLNDELIEENYIESQYAVPLELLSNIEDNNFIIIGKSGNNIISTFEFTIHIRGCDDADWYVSSNGDDANDGKTKQTPFKTLEKACSMVNGIYNLIALMGNIETEGEINVNDFTIIIGCGNATLTNTSSNVFFNVAQNEQLIIQDIVVGSSKEPFTSLIDNMVFTNENIISEVENVINYSMDNGVLLSDLSETQFIKDIQFNTATGNLTYWVWDVKEFTKLSDLTGVITDMNLVVDDDVYYTEYVPITTDEHLLQLPFVYFEDRKGLENAVEFLTYDNVNGILTETICGDEIIWQAKSH